MIKKGVLAILLSTALVISIMPSFKTAYAATGDWKLVWNDEFNGAAGTGVDASKWVYETGGGGWGNGELQNYTNRTDNVYMEQDPLDSNNRYLTIKAIKESYGGSQYTSGRIKTNGKFDFAYGKVEMRAKLPSGKGIWPAFWMLGSDIGTNGWPKCGETDIMEFVGSTPTKIYGTIHGPEYNGAGGIGGWHDNQAGFTNDFHTYSVEWEPNVIRWYFDGRLFEQRTTDDLFGGTWVFNHNNFILLNLAVGGAWPGSPDASTSFPQKYMIDYVRVYQREGGVYPTPTSRSLIQLKNVGNGQFVCSDRYNGNLLYANRGAAGSWETFEQKDLGNGNIALISLMDYKYASATASNNQLIASKESIGATETFQKVTNADGTISLKCAANGNYVTAPGTGVMSATATTIGNNEKFNLISVNGVQPPLQVLTPTLSPAGGAYASAQSVTLSCATAGATIKYTLDGSTPTVASATYTAAINVSATTTIKAYALKSGLTDSSVATSNYTISSLAVNLALNKTGTASSGTANLAFDGNAGSRWESNFSDPQWIFVNLGSSYSVTGVKLNWETAAGKDYKIEVSTDKITWVQAYIKAGGIGGVENITFTTPVTGQYVRMSGTARTTVYGYSLWEFEVYGKPATNTAAVNIALNKLATASTFVGRNTAALAFDGNAGSRFESISSDPQWISVDLGSSYSVTGVKLNWETAAGKDYKIEVSTDKITWVVAYAKVGGTGGVENITFVTPVTGQYVRMSGTARTTGYGYSLWEFEVYGALI